MTSNAGAPGAGGAAGAPADKKVQRTQWIVIAMVAGIVAGYAFPAADYPGFIAFAKSVSSVFLRMITLLIVPLLFSSLVVGIAGHGDDLKRVGRLAFRSVAYFAVATTLALFIGLAAVNLVRPGAGISLAGANTTAAAELAPAKVSVGGVVAHVVPQSVFDAAARNEVLQVVFFSILFAVGLASVHGRPRVVMVEFCESLADVMFKFVGIVMLFAPFGIGAAIAVTVGTSGLAVLKSLALLVITLYGALIVFAIVVLLPVALIARIPIRAFWTYVSEPWLLALSTASSEAALPVAMQNLERLGIPRRIIAFVMPAGYAFNLDGSTLYLAVASVFAAQAGGIEMTVGQQLVMVLTLILASKGVASVPRASLVVLAGALTMFGLPLEAVAVILGVDAIMEMGRTSINLLGNTLATAVMARWEGEFPEGQGVEARS